MRVSLTTHVGIRFDQPGEIHPSFSPPPRMVVLIAAPMHFAVVAAGGAGSHRGFLGMHPKQVRPEEGRPPTGARRVFAVLRERERVREVLHACCLIRCSFPFGTQKWRPSCDT